jgi:hypothetical protein
MSSQGKIIKIFKRTGFLLVLFAFLFSYTQFFSITSAQVEEELEPEKSTIGVILRDSNGNYIPNLNFEIYAQVDDVDGLPKPGKRVGGSRIDSNIGKGEVAFTDNSETYLLKAWDKNSTDGAFYFYDEIYAYNSNVEITEVLSAIKFVFRDTEEALLKNIKFSLYTQRQDADGDPIKESNDLVASLDTSEEGEQIVFVSSGIRSLDGEASDYYVMEVVKAGSGRFVLYDIEVNDGGTTEIDYMFSDFKLKIQDANSITFPAKTKIEIFKQVEDVDGERAAGEKVKDIYTDDDGVAVFEYPQGMYIAKIMGADKQYQSFWDLEIQDQERRNYTLTTGVEWDPGSGSCEAASTFNFIARNMNGDYVPGLKYELYEQIEDVNGVVGVGVKKVNGVVDEYGKGLSVFNPDPRKKYALKVYDKNATVGEYWFFDAAQFKCGEDVDVEKNLSSLLVVLRDGEGELLKNYKFSLHTQKYDVDGKPIKEKKDLIASNITTSEKGRAVIYLASNHLYDMSKKGKYVFTARGKNGVNYEEYDIDIVDGMTYDFEYVLSDVVVKTENALGQVLENKDVFFYEQERNISGDYVLGKLLKNSKTDSNGEVSFEYPFGYYAVVVKDSVGKNSIFWNAHIKNRTRSYKNIKTNVVRVKAKNEEGDFLGNSTLIYAYSMVEDENGFFLKNKNIKKEKLSITGNLDLSLKPDPYLVTFKKGTKEYGKAIYTENEKLQEVVISTSPSFEIVAGQKFILEKPKTYSGLAEKLRGKILLQVESRGEAWYVEMKTSQRYYMKDGETAYGMMRKFGLGITNADLEKIPIGLDIRFAEFDYDGDRVSDNMEEALGTDMYLPDSDNDSYFDGDEIDAGYRPNGSGAMPIDTVFTNKQKGQILLQVESRGEAWYVNPSDGKRYYMKDGASAYEIMRFLSLGITNNNLEKIESGYIDLE